MSGVAARWVDHHSPTRGSQRAVLRALALKADDDGKGARPTWAWLEKRTGRSRRTIARVLKELRAAGMIRRHDDCGCDECLVASRNGVVVYDVVLGVDKRVEAGQQTLDLPVTETPRGVPFDTPDETENGTGAKGCQGCQGGTGRGATVAPLKDKSGIGSLSLEQVVPSETAEETAAVDATELQAAPREGARTREAAPAKPVTYRGRTVQKATVQLAEHLLGTFNQATGQRLSTRTGDGRPSPSLKQIVGALMERPGEPADVWERGVVAMVADPPDWIEGRFTIGHLFGLRAAEHTLARGRDQGAIAAPRRNGGLGSGDWRAIAAELQAREGAAA